MRCCECRRTEQDVYDAGYDVSEEYFSTFLCSDCEWKLVHK